MRRLALFLMMVLVLTASMYVVWAAARLVLPQAILRPYFVRLFSLRVGGFTFLGILLANLVPFSVVVFMNLFKGNRLSGGAFAIPVFWVLYGLILGTNSFVYAGQPVAISIDVLWRRSGFMELLAYTAGFEASRRWALWKGFFRSQRIEGARSKPYWQDWIYMGLGIVLLVVSAVRETLA